MTKQVQLKTESECAFLRYLEEYGYESDYELDFPGKNKKPDFFVRREGVEFLVDAKERAPKSFPVGARHTDPMKGIRSLIKKGQNKFEEFNEYICIVAVQNIGDGETSLNPWWIFGAMLGVPALTATIEPPSGTIDADSAHSVFMPVGGKMIKHYSPIQPHESTKNISAIVIPTSYHVPNPAFHFAFQNAIALRERSLKRSLSVDEKFQIQMDAAESPTLKVVPRVVVCLNPFARFPLPENIFNELYDERWTLSDGSLERVFAGSEIANVESDPFTC